MHSPRRESVPKYRRPVIEGAVDQRLTQIAGEVCAERDSSIVELVAVPERVPLRAFCDRQYGIHAPGQYQRGQVVPSAPWRVLPL